MTDDPERQALIDDLLEARTQKDSKAIRDAAWSWVRNYPEDDMVKAWLTLGPDDDTVRAWLIMEQLRRQA
jgi:hypothetical protein